MIMLITYNKIEEKLDPQQTYDTVKELDAQKGIVWLNSELAKKPERTIDYVIVHELAHLISSSHDRRFTQVLDKEIAHWRDIRRELNKLPLAAWVG